MRNIEFFLVILLFLSWANFVFPHKKPFHWLIWLPIITFVMGIIYLIIEKFRWQMIPIYTLTILFIALSSMRLLVKKKIPLKKPESWVIKVVGNILGFVPLIVAAALPILFPQFMLPEPTGPYTVGTTSFEWIDRFRPEVFTVDTGDHRDLFVQVWYPAEKVAGARPLPMWPPTFGPLFAKLNYLPGFLFDHLSLIPSHTYPELPLSTSQTLYPVLIFSHAYFPGFAGQNLVQMEELASHGYVVFSIAHPYKSSAVLYPDGRVVPVDEPRMKAYISELGNAEPIRKQFMAEVDLNRKERLFRQYLQATPTQQESVNIWAQDTIFVMDQIERLHRGVIKNQLSGHLDMDRVGLFGMSLGGAVTGEVCMLDGRCKAGANLDAIQVGSVIDGAIQRPFMLFDSSANARQNDCFFDRFQNKLYRIVVKNSTHFNYTDFSLITPLFKVIGLTGPINPYRMETIINSYLLSFFDMYLKGVNSPLTSGLRQDYPEVEFVRVMPIRIE